MSGVHPTRSLLVNPRTAGADPCGRSEQHAPDPMPSEPSLDFGFARPDVFRVPVMSIAGCKQAATKRAPLLRPAGRSMTDRDAVQRGSARQMASEKEPTKRRLTAQVASKLNQLRDTNFSPK